MSASCLSGRRVLVTGAAGYIAASVVRRLARVDCHVVRLSRRTSLAPPEGVAVFEDVTGDVRSEQVWERVLEGVDVVFHLAGQTSVETADRNPEEDFEINVRPLMRMLHTCRQRGWRPSILFAGTETQAGVPECSPVDESHPDRPVTVYDLHKLLAEQYLKYYVRRGVVRGASLRLTTVYGPGPDASAPERGVLNRMMRRALEGGPLTVYGAGDAVRDYLHVDDAARAFLDAACAVERLGGGHFVLGSGEGHTLAEAFRLVAEKARRRTGRCVEVVNVAPPPGQSPIDARNFVADPRRFIDATGWRPRYSLDEGVAQTLSVLGTTREDDPPLSP